MYMGKARTNRRGFTKEQELIQENRTLKRQISSLRKQLARVELDRYDAAKEIIQEHYTEDREEQGKEILENLKKSWACRECDGYLEIKLYSKVGETWYFRKCNNCTNRTKSQRYNDKTVKGIIKEVKDE
jgi:hypothetical protein